MQFVIIQKLSGECSVNCFPTSKHGVDIRKRGHDLLPIIATISLITLIRLQLKTKLISTCFLWDTSLEPFTGWQSQERFKEQGLCILGWEEAARSSHYNSNKIPEWAEFKTCGRDDTRYLVWVTSEEKCERILTSLPLQLYSQQIRIKCLTQFQVQGENRPRF